VSYLLIPSILRSPISHWGGPRPTGTGTGGRRDVTPPCPPTAIDAGCDDDTRVYYQMLILRPLVALILDNSDDHFMQVFICLVIISIGEFDRPSCSCSW
jgi:hypothetical protein